MGDNYVYASKTTVSVQKSKNDIEKLVKRHGSPDFGLLEYEGRVMIAFKVEGRNVRFSAPMPDGEQEKRTLYRGLLLTIRAKYESAKAGIETYDEAFMSQIIVPGGGTVGDEVLPKIRQAYIENKSISLLPSI